MSDKFKLQSSQYEFPYHYLVSLESREFARNLDWGLDYLSYMGRVLDLVRKYLDRELLDVGCGDGYLLYHLARSGAFNNGVKAVGIDVDEKAIKFAQAFSHGLPVEFLFKDFQEHNAKSGLITAVETLEHIPHEDIESFTSHMDALLRSSGVLIISVPSTVRPVIEKHYRHYNLEMLRAYFPSYELLEVHHITARRNLLYQIVARLLSHKHFNLNFSPFKRVLFRLHDRLTRDVSEDRGAHIVAVFRKPEARRRE